MKAEYREVSEISEMVRNKVDVEEVELKIKELRDEIKSNSGNLKKEL
jgi:hypothetical protein